MTKADKFADALDPETPEQRAERIKQMRLQRARSASITRALANGTDPHSGVPLPPDHLCNRPEVVRALFEALACLDRSARASLRHMPRTGEPWTEDEDRKLLAAFDAGRALQELAGMHERTMGAVRARLLKYGRINA